MNFENLIQRIVNRIIEIPDEDMTARDLMYWLNGYARCQLDILDVIDQMKKESNQQIS